MAYKDIIGLVINEWTLQAVGLLYSHDNVYLFIAFLTSYFLVARPNYYDSVLLKIGFDLRIRDETTICVSVNVSGPTVDHIF